MGKASRGKRRNITRDDDQALRLAAEMILDPRLIETFQSIKLHEKLEFLRLGEQANDVPLLEPPQEPSELGASNEKNTGFRGQLYQQTPTAWADGLRKGVRSKALRERLSAAIEAGRQALREEPDFERQADQFNLDEPTVAQAKGAYCATRARLLAEPAEPAWLTLAIICFARAIATNAHKCFAAEAWDELTSFMYGLERDFLLANGEAFADKLLEFDHVFYEDRLPEIIGSRMPFGLAELACNMADTGLFKLPARF